MLARLLLPLAFVLALVSPAAAEKAKLAVLGLEVAGAMDTDSISHGRLLTERFHAKTGISSKFMLAPNSKKDLLDEKVAVGCDNEAPDCMAKIAVKLKAAYLMYGKIEKRPKDGKEGYQLSMKALDADKKTVKEWGDWIPLADFVEPGALDMRVSVAFDTLTKDTGSGIVVQDPVTGPTGPIGPSPKPGGGGGFPWKTTAYVSTAVTLVAIGGVVLRGLKTNTLEKNCRPGEGLPKDLESSYEMNGGSTGGESASDCANGGKFAFQTNLAGAAAAVFGGLAVIAYYKGFVSKKESSTQTSGRSTRKKKQFAVTPIISPDGAGATFRLDW